MIPLKDQGSLEKQSEDSLSLIRNKFKMVFHLPAAAARAVLQIKVLLVESCFIGF